MKKAVFYVFFMILCTVLICGCESESELERAKKEEEYLYDQYEKAVDEYYEFENDRAKYDYYQQQF